MPRLRFVLPLLLALFAATPVLADTDSERAIALGHDALALYDKGSWAEARAKFEDADKLMHSPVFVLYAARCARNTGDLATAKALYERVAAEKPGAGAPLPWSNAVTSAKEELATLQLRLPTAPTASATATVSVPVPSATVSAPVPTATVSAPVPTATVSAPVPTATVSAPVPTASVNVPVPAATASATASSGPPKLPPSGGSLVPGTIAMSLGIVSLGAGAGLFGIAKSIADGVIQRCEGRPVCDAADLPNRNTAVALADTATGAFLVGGALAAAGVVLFVLRPGPPAKNTASASVAVEPAPMGLRVTGSF
ncbi:MAG: hypothetical protein U0441_01290 [Polyangiaceae bacterium]